MKDKEYQNKLTFRPSKITIALLTSLGIFVTGSAYAQDKEEAEEKTDAIEIIEVKGMRSSIVSAQETKMNANKIMDGISADDMGALPDRSVTETLQRVAGVSIDRYMSKDDPEHFSVEGNGVAVRGLTQVRSELNGRSTFSANGGRTLSFGDVPPELLNAVNVYKSPTADQIEGGLGGTVDLETSLPFYHDGQKVAFSTTANYGDLIKETKPAYSFLYSNNWDSPIGKIGLLTDLAFSELSTRNDSMYIRPFFTRTDLAGHEGEKLYVPRGADWRTMEFNREREGQYLALQWEPAENQQLVFTYFSSDYDMTWNEDAIFVGNDALAIQIDENAEFDSNGLLRKARLYQPGNIPMGSDVRVSTQQAKTQDFSLKYYFSNEQLEFSASTQYVKSDASGFDSTVATEVLVPYIDVDLTGSLPSIDSDSTYLANPANYTWNFTMDQLYKRKADMLAVQADTKYFLSGELLKAVKFGVRFSDTSSDNADTGYNWSPLAPGWLNIVSGDKVPAIEDLHLNTFDNFFNGKTSSPANVYAPVVSYALDYPNSYARLNDKFVYGSGSEWAYWVQRSLDADQYKNNQSEKTYAVYTMAEYSLDNMRYPISGNFGVRYVKTENGGNGYLTFPSTSEFFGEGAYSPIVAENDYSNVLPSFNLKVELTEQLLLRFAAAEAMARPDFSDLAANLTLNASVKEESKDKDTLTADDYDLTSSSNYNPYLKPMESTQFDLSLEWYYEEGNSAYLALFSKDIDGYKATETVLESYAADGYQPYDYRVERPVNAGSAKLKGAEISVNHFFNTLPAPFDGFGVSANYTYIDSSTDTELTTQPVDTDGGSYGKMPYIGISKNSCNIVGMYEKNSFHFRLAYNWRNKYLTSIGANGFNGDTAGVLWKLPVYNAAAGYLDSSISYDINEHYSIALEANNLSNTINKNIMSQVASGDHYSAYHASDRRYALSLRGSF